MSVRDVIIVGAGPSGLATAIAAKHFNLDYVVLEQGALVDAIVRFPINMVFFTTPELLEIGGIAADDAVRQADPRRRRCSTTGRWSTRFSCRCRCSSKVDRRCERAGRRRDEPFAVESRDRARRHAHSRGAQRRAGDGLLHAAEHAQHSRRGSAARHALLQGSASVLPPARRDRRRQELGGRSRARDSSRRRPRHDGASRRGFRRVGEVLGEARHRESRQGRLDRRALQRERGRDSSERSRARFRRDAAGRSACCCSPAIAPIRSSCAASASTINPETLEPKYSVETYETNVPGSVRRRRPAGGEEDRHRVHRERPVSRRGDREDAGVASAA